MNIEETFATGERCETYTYVGVSEGALQTSLIVAKVCRERNESEVLWLLMLLLLRPMYVGD